MRREINAPELSFFYQKTGEAVWHLQYVEDFLSHVYFIKAIAKEPNSIAEQEAIVKLKKLQKKTLGQLISLVDTDSVVSPSLIENLKIFNKRRKWVVHNSMRENGDDLYTEYGRNKFISKICAFTEMATNLQKSLETELLQYGVSQGISQEQINTMAKNHISNLKGQN